MAVYDSCVMTSQNFKSGVATSKVGGVGGGGGVCPPYPPVSDATELVMLFGFVCYKNNSHS